MTWIEKLDKLQAEFRQLEQKGNEKICMGQLFIVEHQALISKSEIFSTKVKSIMR